RASATYILPRWPPPPTVPLFPYTTLFRSRRGRDPRADRGRNDLGHRRPLHRSRGAASPGSALRARGGVTRLLRREEGFQGAWHLDRKSTRLNSSDGSTPYAAACSQRTSAV